MLEKGLGAMRVWGTQRNGIRLVSITGRTISQLSLTHIVVVGSHLNFDGLTGGQYTGAVPGIRQALAQARAKVAAVSPIIGGRALKGPADRMLTSLGHESSAIGVAKLYADFLDVLVLDNEDAGLASDIEALDIAAVVTNTIMRDAESRTALAGATLKSIS